MIVVVALSLDRKSQVNKIWLQFYNRKSGLYFMVSYYSLDFIYPNFKPTFLQVFLTIVQLYCENALTRG